MRRKTRAIEALIELLYGAGLRVSELVSLPLRAAPRPGQDHMIIEGKGGKERLVALGGPALAALAAHLEARAAALPKAEAQREKAQRWLFPSASAADGKLTRRRVAQILETAAAKAGIDPGAGFAARAAACVRDASGGRRRRFAHGADAARPRRYCHDADLHACRRGAA